MNEDHHKGMLCGLLAAGLRVEGLLRVALERPETRDEMAPQIREAFELYAAIFRQAWPEAGQPAADEAAEGLPEVAESEPAYVPVEVETAALPEEEPVAEPEPAYEPEPEPEPEPAPAPVVVPASQPAPEPVIDPVPEHEVIVVEAEADVPVSGVKPLADTLKVDELIARKESADLRRAFTLNDKFRFRRTLFGGSDAHFSEVLDALEGFGTYEHAERYLAGVIDMECDDAEDFLNIVNAHFGGKQ